MKSFKITQSITDRQDASLGLYFKDVSKQSMIDSTEEIELAKRIKKGDKKAMDKLINANLRFVISVAKQYQNKGIPLVDLIQSGNLGLCKIGLNYLTILSDWVVSKIVIFYFGLIKILNKFTY